MAKPIPQYTTFAPTAPPEYKLEVVALRPDISSRLEDYLRKSPSRFLVGDELSRTFYEAGLSLGPRQRFNANLTFRAISDAPVFKAAPKSSVGKSVAIPSSIIKTAQAIELVDALRGPIEELAKSHPGLDTPLDVLGVVVAPVTLWAAIKKPGGKNKFEICLAVADTGVWMAKLVTDLIPGLQHAKPALSMGGVILKTGKGVYAVFHKPAER